MADRDEVRRVEPTDWAAGVRAAHDQGYSHFDWLGCLDDIGREPTFTVLIRLLRPEDMTDAVRISTQVPRDRPELDSIADVFAGAGWHERESAELYDISFLGGDPRRLLLAADSEPGPLRKDQVLAARAAQDWPGAVEPGESSRPDEADRAGRTGGRRRLAATGVPDPELWGDRRAKGAAEPEEVVRSSGGGRARRRP